MCIDIDIKTKKKTSVKKRDKYHKYLRTKNLIQALIGNRTLSFIDMLDFFGGMLN